MNLDLINGAFEALAAVSILNHCRVLYKQKEVSGVSLLSTTFFFTWGIWNIYYYPSIGQTFSYLAGISVAVANALWIGLMVKYRKPKTNKWPNVSYE